MSTWPWKEILIVAILAAIGYLGYSKVYNIGYTAAAAVYQKQLNEYNDNLNKRIVNIENNSSALLDLSNANREAASKEYKAIIAATRGKPLYTINSGVCTLSPDFVKAYTDAINRANKK